MQPEHGSAGVKAAPLGRADRTGQAHTDRADDGRQGVGVSALNEEEAAAVLTALAAQYFSASGASTLQADSTQDSPTVDTVPILEARYRTLLEQISAIVFMAYLDRGVGDAYVSPQIEKSLGFTQQEWLDDPIRWYEQIHPDDKQRWSVEAAQMFLTGAPLRSIYRVFARDGHVVWFHCEARMVRHADGRPWFIQGVAFDVTELKRTERALQDERNVLSAILDTVGALVVVLYPDGRIARFNRACEQTTGQSSAEVEGRSLIDLFMVPEDVVPFTEMLADLGVGRSTADYETSWKTPAGLRRIEWSTTALTQSGGALDYIIATGIDITERRRL